MVAFLEWKSTNWLSKREAQSTLAASDIQSGLDGYAQKQAAVYRSLTVSFLKLWHSTLVSHNLNHSWATACIWRHEVLFVETSTSTSRSHASDMEYDQPNTSPTPQIHGHSGAHNTVQDTLLDTSDSDSSMDSAWTDTNESEDDDLDFNFEFD